MIKKSKMLFVINGFGMGNATRCEAIMQILEPSFDFSIVTSDKAFDFFKKAAVTSKLYQQRSLKGIGGNVYGTLNFFSRSLVPFLVRLIKNWKIQRKIFHEDRIDVAVFDSDYSFILHRVFSVFSQRKIKIVGINNSLDVIHYFNKNKSELTSDLFLSYLIEVLDFWMYRIFCDQVVCPSLDAAGPATAKFGQLTRINPLVRRSLVSEFNSMKNTISKYSPDVPAKPVILVYPSSANVKSPIYRFCNKQDTDSGFQYRNEKRLVLAEYIIANAGQATLSESLYLRKKIIVVPIPQHAEQYVNAKLLQSYGAFIYTEHTKADLAAILPELKPLNANSFADFSSLEVSVRGVFERYLEGLQ